MQYRITAPLANRINQEITLPASKSISNRVLIMNALGGGKGHIGNIAHCDDTDVMVKALAQPAHGTIDIGAAGTAMRFLTAYLSQKAGEDCLLTGSERMKKRPISILVEALRQVGADIEYAGEEGFPPLHIRGKKLKGGKVSLDGSVSSQYISALLMAAPAMQNGLQLTLENKTVSRPYIQMTLQLMKQFGVASKWEENQISVGPQDYGFLNMEVESDWSASSYWYQLCALAQEGEVTLPRLYADSVQGDSHIASLFEPLGIATSFEKNGIKLIKKAPTTTNYVVNLVEQPDLAQTLVVTCCLLNIHFTFSGLDNLKIKETDRIAALITEMSRLGYRLTEPQPGSLAWEGEHCPAEQQPVIGTYKDHRMAMAFAPVCLLLDCIRIEDPAVVSKSYPKYWEDLKKAGFGVEEIE